MFGCYRKDDSHDPETYCAAVAAILSEYPSKVVDLVTDPRTGIPGRSKWLPAVAEIREACEDFYAPIRREATREENRKRRERELASESEQPRDSRPTYQELKQRCADAGLPIGGKFVQAEKPVEKILTEYGVSQDQWDKIPNAKDDRWRKL